MYRRPKFLEILLEIRREMAREVDYDVDLFAEVARFGKTGERFETGSDKRFGHDVEDLATTSKHTECRDLNF